MKSVLLIALALSPLAFLVGAKMDAPVVAGTDTEVCVFDVARAWVAENMDALPTTLEGISEFDSVHRRVILGALPVDIRIALWQENIQATIQRNSLSPDQARWLEGVRSEIPRLLTAPLDVARDEVDEISEAARGLLGDRVAGEALRIIGTPPATADTPAVRAECTCAVDSDWCAVGMGCGFGGCTRPPEPDCGTLGLYICDGKCGITQN